HAEQMLAAPYVLDALDDNDRRTFESHLATCSACSEEVRSLRRVADRLAFAAPLRTPRPELRARVLAALPERPRVDELATRELGSRLNVRGWLPLAAAVVLSIGLGIHAWQLQRRVSSLETRL